VIPTPCPRFMPTAPLPAALRLRPCVRALAGKRRSLGQGSCVGRQLPRVRGDAGGASLQALTVSRRVRVGLERLAGLSLLLRRGGGQGHAGALVDTLRQ